MFTTHLLADVSDPSVLAAETGENQYISTYQIQEPHVTAHLKVNSVMLVFLDTSDKPLFLTFDPIVICH